MPGALTTRIDPETTKEEPKPGWALALPAVNVVTWTQGNVAQSKMCAAPASFDASGAPTTKVLPERARESPNPSSKRVVEALKGAEASVQEVLQQVNIWTTPA